MKNCTSVSQAKTRAVRGVSNRPPPARPLRVLIAPDKFKGTLSAAQAAQALARGWQRVRPADKVILCPVSDGGDGFGEVLAYLLGAHRQITRAVDAAHRPCRVTWWFEPRTRTAIVESARVIGLAMLPAGRFHPFELDTTGLGLVLRAAARRGAVRCILGLGGSATNDGGFGMACALGWKFYDAAGRRLESWTALDRLARVVPPAQHRWFRSLIAAVDVRNPLLGARGATRAYGPQKGMRPEQFVRAEACLRRWAAVLRDTGGRDFARLPGAGAAGGLGLAAVALLGGRFVPGFELVARHGGLRRHLARAEVVLTGEGALDRSTLMGKAVGRVATLCRQRGRPCLAFAGIVRPAREWAREFAGVYALTDFTSMGSAQQRAAFWLERLATWASREFTERTAV